MTEARRIEKFLHQGIPLAKQMKVEVFDVNLDAAILRAPLEPNLNHHMTAFGGSINSMCLLSCWSLVAHVLKVENLETEYVVIQDSQIDYKTPVDSDFSARATWVDEGDREKFIETLRRHGRARVTLQATVSSDSESGQVAARLTGRFAARLKGTRT